MATLVQEQAHEPGWASHPCLQDFCWKDWERYAFFQLFLNLFTVTPESLAGMGGGGRSELVFGKYLPENRAKVEEQRSGRETSGNTAS